jgi:hypothetical protein
VLFGCGFTNEYDVISLDDFDSLQMVSTQTAGTDFGITYGFSLGNWAKISASGGADLNYSMNETNIQFMDMDADGIVDLVFTPDETTLAICYSKLGRTGLLKQLLIQWEAR